MKTEILSGLQIAGISTTVENNIITQNQLIKRQKNYLEKQKFKNSSDVSKAVRSSGSSYIILSFRGIFHVAFFSITINIKF